MKQFWLTLIGSTLGVVLGTILLIMITIFTLGGLIGSALHNTEPRAGGLTVGQKAVLELDLRELRFDQPESSPFAFANPLSIVELSQTLNRAAEDDQVAGLFIRANTLGMPTAHAEEISAMLDRFSESGKFVIAHAQGFESPSLTGYFAVAGADELWMQETAPFMASGFSTETLFLGGLFERLGVSPQFIQRHEFKTAVNTFTETGYTEAHREATQSWLDAMFASATTRIAERRGLDLNTLTDRIYNTPYSAEQALQAELVDRLGHVAQAQASALSRVGAQAQLIDVDDYGRQPQRPITAASPVIALVSGQGSIVTGETGAQLGAGPTLGSDSLASAIDMAAADVRVRAIILRVDSPGGSAVASDQVWDAVRRARQSGKPVIASLGATAASGGYYIAAGADMIVANATTLTGSIGVFSGKFSLAEALSSSGLALEPLSAGGEFTTVNSLSSNWSESQAAAQAALADDVYQDFTGRVAEGRDLPLARVSEIARGRVWTGAQAVELGLVDRIGGLNTAIEAARELAAIGADEAVVLRAYPAPMSPFEALENLFGTSAQTAEGLAQLTHILQSPEVQALIEAQATAQRSGAQLKLAQ